VSPPDGRAPPFVACLDGFLPPAGCAEILRELRFTRWRPSAVVARDGDGVLRSGRTWRRRSETATADWFVAPLLDLVADLERRIEATFGVAPERFEGWQATRFGETDGYDFHLDAGGYANEPGGEREWTFLLFLDTPAAGGGTAFRHLDRTYEASAGRLLAWRNLTEGGAPDERLLHAATPVTAGTKTTLMTWARQRAVRPDPSDPTIGTRAEATT
jgi:prolyl 4-hydroxylase